MNTGDKLLSVLGLYTLEKSEWTVEEAANEIGVSVSSAYRYFRSLAKVGLIEAIDGSAYTLGPASVEFDRKIRLKDPMIQVGRSVMQRLIRHAGTGVSLLCRVHRNYVMCIHQEGKPTGDYPISYERGRLMPMFRGAASKAIFANLPSRAVRWHFERSPQEICEAGLGCDWETLTKNLRQIRKKGVVVASGEVDRNRVGIAAPVFNSKRVVIGSLCMVILNSEASPESISNFSALVEASARQIHAYMSDVRHTSPFEMGSEDSGAVETA